MTPLPAELETGHPEIDGAHRRLIAEVELLRTAVQGPGVPPRLGVVREFLAYLREHFCEHFLAEEGLAERAGFPSLWEHRDAHLRMFDRFTWHRARIERGPTRETVEAFVADMEAWVREHVLTEDARLAAWIRETGAGAARGAG